MTNSLTLIDMFVRGAAVGAMMLAAISILRGGVSRDGKIAGVWAAISLSAWLMTESRPLWAAFGQAPAIMFLALPESGVFWLLVTVIFEDYRVTPLTLTPSGILVVSGIVMFASSTPLSEYGASGLLRRICEVRLASRAEVARPAVR